MTTQLDTYTACGLAEGLIEADSEEQVIEAWRYLHDTGVAYSLQGWVDRRQHHAVGTPA